ncbi:MAG: hypothetical protein ACI4U0_06920 [Candidatus Aphodocola sp.]
MKNKKIIIIVGVILVLILGVGAFIFLNSNNVENSVNEVKILLEKDNYNEATKIIKDKDLLSKADEETNKIIKTRMTKYKVSSLEDYLKLTSDDWKNIKSFNEMINNLDLSNKYTYLSKLIEINDKYQEYVPAINWQNSDDYEVFRSYMKVETQDDFEKSALMMKNYSFEKYDLNNKYIKELNDEVQNYINYCTQLAKAINESDLNLYDSISPKLKENITKLSNIEVDIITKTSELEKEIKNLPTI